MSGTIDFVELAREIAEIASTSSDANAAAALLQIADRLLMKAGLPPAPEPPSALLSRH